MAKTWLLGLGFLAGSSSVVPAIIPVALAQCQDVVDPIDCHDCETDDGDDTVFDLLQVAQYVRASGAEDAISKKTLDAQPRRRMASVQGAQEGDMNRTDRQPPEQVRGCPPVECPFAFAQALVGSSQQAVLRAVGETSSSWKQALLVLVASLLLLVAETSLLRWLDSFTRPSSSSPPPLASGTLDDSGYHPYDAEKLRVFLAEIYKVCHDYDDVKQGKKRLCLNEKIGGAEFESVDVDGDGVLQALAVQFPIDSVCDMSQIDAKIEAKLGEFGLGSDDLHDYMLEMVVTDSSGVAYLYDELGSLLPNGPSDDMFPAVLFVKMSKT